MTYTSCIMLCTLFPRPAYLHEDRVLGPQQCRGLAQQAATLQNYYCLRTCQLYGTCRYHSLNPCLDLTAHEPCS
ncbi:hypothetical protein BJY52DRAFT_1303448, partial [Lactarius psammicola]